jgi:hypothetical protein
MKVVHATDGLITMLRHETTPPQALRYRSSGTKWTLLHGTGPSPGLRRRETSSASGRQPLSAGHDMRLMMSKVLMCNIEMILGPLS